MIYTDQDIIPRATPHIKNTLKIYSTELLELLQRKYEEGYRLLDYQTLISFIESKHNIMDLDVATKRCNQGSAPWLCPTFYKWAKEAAQRSQIKPIQKFDAFLTLPFQFLFLF